MRWVVPPSSPARPALEALRGRFPALDDPGATPLTERFADGQVVRADGTAWAPCELVGPGDQLWFHRELRPERVAPVDLEILHRDDHLLVLDKPHDMATMPRGAHVLSSALVRLRRATGITTLSPLHRLDRRTAGVLAFGVRPEDRAAYQQMFARGEVDKEYLARVADPARHRPGTGTSCGGEADARRLPTQAGARTRLEDRLVARREALATQVVPGPPNALTDLEVLDRGTDGTLLLRLRPLTGRTHQLRVQLSTRGAPILGEDLYPHPSREGSSQPGSALQLLATRLSFTDPVTGQQRSFRSGRSLGA